MFDVGRRVRLLQPLGDHAVGAEATIVGRPSPDECLVKFPDGRHLLILCSALEPQPASAGEASATG